MPSRSIVLGYFLVFFKSAVCLCDVLLEVFVMFNFVEPVSLYIRDKNTRMCKNVSNSDVMVFMSSGPYLLYKLWPLSLH